MSDRLHRMHQEALAKVRRAMENMAQQQNATPRPSEHRCGYCGERLTPGYGDNLEVDETGRMSCGYLEGCERRIRDRRGDVEREAKRRRSWWRRLLWL